jgi:GNAT superfamily N-acetyltransferase
MDLDLADRPLRRAGHPPRLPAHFPAMTLTAHAERLEMPVAVRRAEEADITSLVEFNLRLAQETEGRSLDPVRLDAGIRRALAAPNRARYYVAEKQTPTGAQAVGQSMVTYEWSDWRNGCFWWLQSVYVRPDQRRRGVFRALFAAIRAEASRTPDVCGLRLYVEQDNREAMAVYRSLGMAPGGYVLYERDWSTGG